MEACYSELILDQFLLLKQNIHEGSGFIVSKLVIGSGEDYESEK